jgi:hypothetical protein
MTGQVILCGDFGQYLPCQVCKGKKSHHYACPVPVLGPPSKEDEMTRKTSKTVGTPVQHIASLHEDTVLEIAAGKVGPSPKLRKPGQRGRRKPSETPLTRDVKVHDAVLAKARENKREGAQWVPIDDSTMREVYR